MENHVAITIFLSLLGGGSFITFITFLINRFDKKKENNSIVVKELQKTSKQISDLKTDIELKFKCLNKKIDDNDAIQKRVRILRFFDELQTDYGKFSKDAWNQIMDDVYSYEKYCEDNEDFMNSKAKDAINNLKIIHQNLLERQRKGERVYS